MGEMRNLTSRIERVERHSAAGKEEGILMIVDGMPPARMNDEIIDFKSLHRGLSNERCIEILKECGHLRTGPWFSLVDLYRIPRGLSSEDTERFLREHGEQVCSPKQPGNSVRTGGRL
jgi:hypothetical protein